MAISPFNLGSRLAVLCAALLLHASTALGNLRASEYVRTDQMPGRPLLLTAAGGVEHVYLRSAVSIDEESSAEHRKAYLVRVENPVPTGLLEAIRAAAGQDLRYAPHDAYIVSMSQTAMMEISTKEGVVGVFDVPTELKVDPSLLSQLHQRRISKAADAATAKPGDERDSKQSQNQLRAQSGKAVFLVGTSTQIGQSATDRDAYAKHVHADMESCGLGNHVTVKVASSTRLSCTVTDDDDTVSRFVSCAADAWWSTAIARASRYRALNFYTNRIAQSGTLETPIWDAGLRGEGEVIGVADTGLDWDGCYFTDLNSNVSFCVGDGAIPDCVNFNHRKVVTYRTVQSVIDADPISDPFYEFNRGHGSHVAGTVLGNYLSPDGDFTLARENGVAPDAKLAFDDVDDTDAEYFEVPADLAEDLFPHSYEEAGARIHSNSWGGADTGYSFQSMDVDIYSYEHDDMLILFAASNEGSRSSVTEPSTNKNGISVGATQNAPERFGSDGGERTEEVVASYSSRGPAHDGRIKPEVHCVGSSVLSASANDASGCPSVSSETTTKSGTSMATPACAGAAALAREYLRKGYWPSGQPNAADGFNPSSALVKAMLINSATTRPVRHPDFSDVYSPSAELGFGLVDLSSVLRFTQNATNSSHSRNTSTRQFELMLVNHEVVQHGTFHEYYVSGYGQFRVTLVWTDPPSYPGAERTLVNNLDLVVVLPNGVQMLGNDFDGNGVADDLNNVEHVTVPAGHDGVHRVQVRGTELPWLPRANAFALVIAGDFVDEEVSASGPLDGVVVPANQTCAGKLTLTDAVGSLSDGSGDGNYSGRLFCEWLIMPPNATSIRLSISEFEVREGDYVEFFQCADQHCLHRQLLGEPGLYGSLGSLAEVGPPTELTGYSGFLLIRFVTDAAGGAAGFDVSWTASNEPLFFCSGSAFSAEVSGSFSEADGPYESNTNCEWLIAPHGATGVHLVFHEFATEEDYDFVELLSCLEIVNETCVRSKRIELLSGTNDGYSLLSPSGALLVKFISDASVVDTGFVASWNASFAAVPPDGATAGCGGVVTFTDGEGAFSDGSGAGNYANELSCEWIIAPRSADVVDLEFPRFETEQDFDTVEVYRCGRGLNEFGACDGSVRVATLTGSASGSTVNTGGGVVLIVFRTDDSFTASGFSVQWATRNVTCAGTVVLTSPQGAISDGSGAGDYENDLDCSWIIAPPGALYISLVFDFFETERGFDYVYLYECPSASNCNPQFALTLTGSQSGRQAVIPSPAAEIQLVTDGSVTGAGFSVSWSAKIACFGLVSFTGRRGSFSDGSGDDDEYANRASCEWIIAPAGAVAVELWFTFFETEEGWDFVTVLECFTPACEPDMTNTLAELSGSLTGQRFTTSYPALKVMFDSDSSVTRQGFNASWSATLPCLATPERLPYWPDPQSASCRLDSSWPQLAPRLKQPGATAYTGGLGRLTQQPQYLVWVCVEGHACGEGRRGTYCFVYDELEERFDPWGTNQCLELVPEAP